MLRQKAVVYPKTYKAFVNYANHLNNNPVVNIEHKREDRWFFSSPDNPDYWFWVDAPEDVNWSYRELTSEDI
jgi:hypothetical protein